MIKLENAIITILAGDEAPANERIKAIEFLKKLLKEIQLNKKKCDCECNQHYQKMRRLSDGE